MRVYNARARGLGHALKSLMKDLLCVNGFKIACVGTELRGDDEVGLRVCRELARSGIDVVTCEYGLENCIGDLLALSPKSLLIVDAAKFSGEPGDVVVASIESVASEYLVTTHNVPVAVTIEYLRRAGVARNALLLGIRVKSLEVGAGISDEVLRSAKVVVSAIREALKECSP